MIPYRNWIQKILLAIISVVLSSSVHAQISEATQAFDRGTQALHEGAYSEAIEIFADHLNNLVFEIIALGVEFFKFEALAHRF